MKRKMNYFLLSCSLVLATLTPLQIASADNEQVTQYSNGTGTQMTTLTHGIGQT